MYKVLLADILENEGVEIFEKDCEVTKSFEIDEKGVLEVIDEYDAVLVRGNTPITKEIIDKGSKLKVVGVPGVGLNHIDVEYAKQKNIKVCNIPGGNDESVAELTFAHILCLNRNVWAASKKVREESCWNKFLFMGSELAGKTLGILGLGRIGQRVAEIAGIFHMNVIAFDPYVSPSSISGKIELVSFDELLTKADIVTVHTPLTQETYHSISTEQFARMKSGAYIVNMSRGGVIDEEALYEALKSGKLAGAGSDVMENEPSPQEKIKHSKLFDLENFLITPHLGAWTSDAQTRVAKLIAIKMVDELKKY